MGFTVRYGRFGEPRVFTFQERLDALSPAARRRALPTVFGPASNLIGVAWWDGTASQLHIASVDSKFDDPFAASPTIATVREVEVMTFASAGEAVAALDALNIEPGARTGRLIAASLPVPAGLASLDVVIRDAGTSDAAKVLAGTLLALAPARAVDGVFRFSVRVDQGPIQNGE